MIASDKNIFYDTNEVSESLKLVRKMRDKHLDKVTTLYEQLSQEEELLRSYTHQEMELEKLLNA
jgi:hypothetical protein